MLHAVSSHRQKSSPSPEGESRRAASGGDAEAEAPRGEAAPGRVSLRPLAALVPYVMRYKPMVLLALAALLLSAAAMLALPLGVRRMIDFGFSAENSRFIDQYFLMMLAIGAVLALASATRFYAVNWIGERVVADLRKDVFSHVIRLSPAYFEQVHSGEVMSRLTADTTQIKSAAGLTASQALRNTVMLIGAVVMMFVTSVKLSLLVLAVIPVIVLPLMGYGRAVRRLSRTAQDTLAEASAYAGENLSAIRIVQAFTYELTAVKRFAQAVERSFRAALARMKARAGLTAFAIFLVFASIVAVLWYGAQEVLAGTITGGRLGQFVLYAAFAAGALAELSEVWGEVQQTAGAAERLSELLNEKPAITSPARPQPLPEPAQGRVAFRHVSFTYPSRPDMSALDDVSFAVEPGETVAFVGPSGAGKTTVFNLLLRFYDPREGQVLVDGVDVAKTDVSALRRRVALVPQETTLFADTIAENIRLGAPDADDEAVREAARMALADEFIRALPEGYETRLGEHGITLSGGQRQRIAIARALLRDAPILLLDEATSALDAESEKAVQTALGRVMAGRTTLVIAHRLATVQRADRILVMDKGRIVEEGKHAALRRKKNGVYARLAELQFQVDAAE
ncbi:MAG: ATP-binding cassette domain-containing protein [Alphaproteobacteria bacterium]|nr:MAG: ATP-binding cassette domain-containing protein [Alphaproteobacteria bacterium]